MEMWKPAIGYEGLYEVSNTGRVRGLERTVSTPKGETKHIRSAEKVLTDVHGYLYCYLYKNGQGKRYAVHRLVAFAFLPNPGNKREINHLDGNKHNNCVENLEWVTRKENQRHAIQTGLWKQYERSGKKNPMYGKHHTESAKEKIAAVHINTKHSEAAKEKMSRAHKGRKFTDSHKKALSESLKRVKTGLRWVNDGENLKSVSPEIAKELVSKGWRYGMKTNKTK